MATQILEAIQQQNAKSVQSLEANMNLMRNDLGTIKADIGMVRTKCEEIDRRCDRLEKEHRELIASTAENTKTELVKKVNDCKRRKQTGGRKGLCCSKQLEGRT